MTGYDLLSSLNPGYLDEGSLANKNIPLSKKGIKPFLKWPGGKRWIAGTLASAMILRLKNRYFEPFLGGGAVFFSLCPQKATLSDINNDLINVYSSVKYNSEKIIQGLKSLPVSKETYYHIRNSEPIDPIERAIRFLYLNRTSFGGIYRLNLAGKFNVPYGGGSRTPEILWKKGLIIEASKALQGKELLVSDFEEILNRSGKGDVVYCDPTYTTTQNNCFVRYNERNFSWDDQERLAASSLSACERGAYILVSNASYKGLTKLYDPFRPKVLTRKCLVSRVSQSRHYICEYLFELDPKLL